MNINFEDLFIFEIANNHQGDVNHGISMIKELGKVVRKYKINAAVKFQYRNLETLIHPNYVGCNDVKHIPRFESTRLSTEDFYTMVKAVKQEKMLTMCTPFDEDSVATCIEHEIDIIKIASCSATDWPLLEEIAKTKKPVIVSTGGKYFSDIDKIYNFLFHRNANFSILHCVGLYPAGYEHVQMNCIDTLKVRYPDVTIGYSGHEDPCDFTIAQIAIAKGAKILERHVGLGTGTIELNSYSTDVREVYKWIEAVQNSKKICGQNQEKIITDNELQSMCELARGCYIKKSVKKGDIISKKDVFFAMPCQLGQTTSGQFEDGMIATQDYNINDAIYEIRNYSLQSDTHHAIHTIKSMLYEAKVVLGSQFKLELSHHYGLNEFRNHGAAIINIINREYCKKIIVVLPGQEHPIHSHKIKEESFQVLFGELNLILNGEKLYLKPGDIVTVYRGDLHGFTSIKGCIFEEVSTTHQKNDSFYIDEKILLLDINDRKTYIDTW